MSATFTDSCSFPMPARGARGKDTEERRREGARGRDRGAGRAIRRGRRFDPRALARRHDPLDRRARRQAHARREAVRPADPSAGGRQPDRRASREGRGPPRRVAEGLHRAAARPAHGDRDRGRPHRLAKGIGYQVVEALGVLERSKVAHEMRSLDQDGRGALRRHGVRFGAYHIFLPALLKPAPRTLAAQLWALRNGGLDSADSTRSRISPAPAAPRSRSIARSPRASTAPPASGSAASGRCASTSWSGSPT